MKLKVSASRMNIAYHCAESLVAPKIKTAVLRRDAAKTGSEFHLIMDSIISEKPIPENIDLTDPDIKWLYRNGAKMWREVRNIIPDNYGSERELSAPDLGISKTTADLVAYDNKSGVVYVVDWKSGYLYHDYRPQLKTYALLAARKHGADKAVCLAINCRNKDVDIFSVTKNDLLEWSRFIKDIENRLGAYVAGEHCYYCERNSECPAIREKVSLYSEERSTVLTQELIKKYRPIARHLEQLLIKYKDAEKAYLAANPDGVDMGDAVLRGVTTKRVDIDYEKAAPVLEEELSPEALEACIVKKINKSAMFKEVSVGEDKKSGRELKDALLSRLYDAGAVNETEYIVPRLVKKKEK